MIEERIVRRVAGAGLWHFMSTGKSGSAMQELSRYVASRLGGGVQGGAEQPADARIILIADNQLMAEIQELSGFNAERMELIPTAAEVMAIAAPGVEVPYFPVMGPETFPQLQAFAEAVGKQLRFYRISPDLYDGHAISEVEQAAIL